MVLTIGIFTIIYEKESKHIFKVEIMEKINYNGVDGVFIPNNEFEEIKKVIAKQNELTERLVKELTSDNSFDYLLHKLKY